jgi:hypothetical protein
VSSSCRPSAAETICDSYEQRDGRCRHDDDDELLPVLDRFVLVIAHGRSWSDGGAARVFSGDRELCRADGGAVTAAGRRRRRGRILAARP